MLNQVLLAVLAVAAAAYWWSRRKFGYWAKKNVKFPPPTPLLGNYGDYILQKKNLGETTQDICLQFPNEPIVGAFYGTEPVAIVQDPEYCKLVMTKDFYYFNGREVSEYTHNEVITRHLFFSGGDSWKVQRQNVSLLFTAAKMKGMFPLIKKCAHTYEEMLDKQMKTQDIFEIRLLVAKFTIDCICSCAFGVESGVMTAEDVITNKFRRIADILFESSKSRAAMLAMRSIWPGLFYGIGLKIFPIEIQDFFKNIINKVQFSRGFKPSTRNDFVDYLMLLKEQEYMTGAGIKNMKDSSLDTKISLKFEDELFSALCTMFFAAGFETSATTSAFTLYELAKNTEVQDHLLEEIDEYLATKNNVLDYDCVSEMPYLEQCIYETARLYPVLPILTRDVYEDYIFPNGVKLERGMRVHIPVHHMHRNPEYFPDPEEYRPERHASDVKKSIPSHSFFPFGEGPRICLGQRFAKMQVKAGIVSILKKYRVELAPGMPRRVRYSSTAMVTQSMDGVNLRLVPREGWEKRVYTST